ncbi:MAG: hypothetical protein M9916_01370 [Crocinitomicaceae bacterium]|nr:hypothetical protein [Crocinitomicaceae bacterium]
MKFILSLLLVVGLVFSGSGQRNLVPGKGKTKKDFFGGEADFKEYRPFGLQLSAGPTFTIPTRPRPITSDFITPGGVFQRTTTPKGIPGVLVEVGMIHFPTKRSKLSQKLKYIFVSYIDWGIGFKMLNGTETTRFTKLDPISGSEISTEEQSGVFNNLFVTARVAVHKNFYIGKKYFIDNGFGVNVDFNFNRKPTGYTPWVENTGTTTHYFHQPLMAHIHYELGFGFRLSRRSMLIPSVQVPIFGLYEWRKGASDFKWFDSNYYPMSVKLKWTYLFEKKVKGCAPARVNDQDKNTMKNQ